MISNSTTTDFIIELAREAGEIALRGFRSRELQVEHKSDFHDMVTYYDRASEKHITQRILSGFPDSSIVAEENGSIEGTGDVTWYIDPIDGTSNFARGLPMWGVSIAAAQNGEVFSAVIYLPATDQMFWADGSGAYLGTERISSWGHIDQRRATIATDFPSSADLTGRPGESLHALSNLKYNFAQVRSIGSCTIGLCWVAAGWLDAAFGFDVGPWDVAAGAFIVRQAGGTYRSYIDGTAHGTGLMATEPDYYASVPGADFPAIADVMKERGVRDV